MRAFWLLFLLLAAYCLTPGTAFAQIAIDGNPVDWPATLNNSAYVSTFIPDANNTNDNQFTTGSQDPDAIADWGWSLGNTNDKGDITNAGAALIGSNLYFFGDRTAVNGDAQIGFWFFKNNVGPIAGGTFSGSHAVGDVLVLSNFTNGGGGVQLRIYEWVSAGGGSLSLIGTTNDAAVNSSDYPVPSYPGWAYSPKFGSGYVTGSFFEGKVDLASLNLDPCFTAFLLETRNAQSVNASLQDLAGGGFNTKPLVSVNSASRCSTDGAVTLTASVTGGVAPLGYSWTGPGGFTSTSSSITVSAAGDYTVTVTGANGCASTPRTGHVTVYTAPTASAGGPDAACQSATPSAITLSGATIGGGATTGTWSILSSTPSGGGTLSSTTPTATPASVTFTPTANYVGTVVLRLTTDAPGTCGVATSDRTITISPAATADAGGDQTVCATSPAVTLAGSVGGGASTGTWSGGTGSFSPNNTTLNATYTPSAAEIAAHGVTLTLTSNDPAGPCGPASDQMNIIINPAATADAGPDQTVCGASPSVTLAGSVGGGATSGTWSGGTGSFSPNATTLNATYTPSAAEITNGSVTLTLTTNDPAGPCGAVSDNMTINISPAATADAGPNQTVCASSPQVQLAGSVSGATGGTWSGGTGSFSPNANTLNAIYTPSASEIASGSVTLTLTSTGQVSPCLAATSSVTITISPAATAHAGGPDAVCQSATPSAITLSGASVGGGATTGAWSILSSTPAGGGTLSSIAQTATPASVTFTPTANYNGTVVLRLTSNVSGACPAATSDRTITIYGLPDAPTLHVDQPTCTQATGTLTVTSTTTDLRFSLDNGPFTAYPSSGWTVSPGSHSVQAMSLAGCISAPATISVDAAPNCLVQHCTLTQGGYGNGNGIICKYPGVRRTQLIANMLTTTDIVLGISGRSIYYAHSADNATNLATAQCIIDRMPAGGTAAALPNFGNVSGCSVPPTILKNGKFNNVLIGQTLALTLNSRLDNTLGAVILSASMTSYATLNCSEPDPTDLTGITRTISASVLGNLGAGATVTDLLALANQALGGAAYTHNGYTPTYSEISNAVAAINELFDNCRLYAGPTAVASLRTAQPINGSASGSTSALAAKSAVEYSEPLHAYPNPFSANTSLEFALPTTTQYTLVVYDIKGALVARVSSGEAQAGVRYTFPLVGSLQEGVYVARLITDKGTQVIRLNLIR